MLGWAHQITSGSGVERRIQQEFCFSISHNPLFTHLCYVLDTSLSPFSSSCENAWTEIVLHKQNFWWCRPAQGKRLFSEWQPRNFIWTAKILFQNSKKNTFEILFTHIVKKLLSWGMHVQPFSQFCVAKGCPSLPAFHPSTGTRGHKWHRDDTDGTGIEMVILFLKMLVFMITKKTIFRHLK